MKLLSSVRKLLLQKSHSKGNNMLQYCMFFWGGGFKLVLGEQGGLL